MALNLVSSPATVLQRPSCSAKRMPFRPAQITCSIKRTPASQDHKEPRSLNKLPVLLAAAVAAGIGLAEPTMVAQAVEPPATGPVGARGPGGTVLDAPKPGDGRFFFGLPPDSALKSPKTPASDRTSSIVNDLAKASGVTKEAKARAATRVEGADAGKVGL